jgi:hypothetical protein
LLENLGVEEVAPIESSLEDVFISLVLVRQQPTRSDATALRAGLHAPDAKKSF